MTRLSPSQDYARVLAQDQNLGLQRDALIKAGGCKASFEDKGSGTRADRLGLAKAQAAAVHRTGRTPAPTRAGHGARNRLIPLPRSASSSGSCVGRKGCSALAGPFRSVRRGFPAMSCRSG
ncbi:hypothetical protein GPA24_18810 [Aromatoleum bremense]|uniref:Resolvase/invertase-type recombinase catalytic domain-containing protein n=1 Tax=Aromatoleum bremense TaxID=76115 RepID=A0ABX1NZQ2_9RHOO|nr:hypothetical protein [Aromatoleum bremense]